MSELVLVNPRKRRRKTTRRKTARRNPVRRKRATRRAAPKRRVTRRRRVRRNPKLSLKSVTNTALMPAVIGAGGALALDVTFGALPIPAQFKSGAMGSVAKIAGAIVLGKVAGKMIGKKRGDEATVGAVTILAYSALKNVIQSQMPNIPLSGSDFAYNPYASMGEYVGAGQMGEYVGSGGTLGYMNAGMGVSAEQAYTPSDGMGEYDYM